MVLSLASVSPCLACEGNSHAPFIHVLLRRHTHAQKPIHHCIPGGIERTPKKQSSILGLPLQQSTTAATNTEQEQQQTLTLEGVGRHRPRVHHPLQGWIRCPNTLWVYGHPPPTSLAGCRGTTCHCPPQVSTALALPFRKQYLAQATLGGETVIFKKMWCPRWLLRGGETEGNTA